MKALGGLPITSDLDGSTVSSGPTDGEISWGTRDTDGLHNGTSSMNRPPWSADNSMWETHSDIGSGFCQV